MKLIAVSENPDLPEAHLLAGLAAKGVQIHWLGHSDASNNHYLTSHNIQFHELKLPSKLSLSAIRSIRALLLELTPEYVYSFTGRALSNTLLASIGMPKIKHLAYRGTAGHLSRIDPVSYLTFLSARLSKIVCVSHAVERYLLAQGVPQERVITIYKGHDPKWYEGAPPIARKELAIPDDVIVAICIANMRPVKGVDLLLEAMREIPLEQKLHLVLVGEVRDPKITTLLKDPRLAGRVHSLGYRRDVASLLKLSDIVVQPSREREGFPKAVLEGMALSKGAIVTNVGGMPELIAHEHTGLVMKAGDVDALRRALINVSNTPEICKTFGAAARRSLEDDFSIAATIEAHYELLKNL